MANATKRGGSLEETREALERWRRAHGGRGKPIPAAFWTDAASVARVHGVGATARALRRVLPARVRSGVPSLWHAHVRAPKARVRGATARKRRGRTARRETQARTSGGSEVYAAAWSGGCVSRASARR